MAFELTITYEGTEPGLAEHRLSLAAFAGPLGNLLLALQRTASGILRSAIDDPDYGSKGGKLATEARLLDLELGPIGKGSAAPVLTVVVRPDARVGHEKPPIENLPDLAVGRLLDDLDAESRGELRNASARRYLVSLPKGVTRQIYLATKDGIEVARKEFGRPKIASVPDDRPRLIRAFGHVVAVGVEPGAPYVTLKTGDGVTKYAATSNSVAQAFALRGRKVLAAVLVARDPRLLWVRAADALVEPEPLEKSFAHIEKRWSETLRILAQ